MGRGIRRSIRAALDWSVRLFWRASAVVERVGRGEPKDIPIIDCRSGEAGTSVDTYWTEHTVNSDPFVSAAQSAAYLRWRFREYPLFEEFMGLWGDHREQIVVDYGCGPGNDVTGFLLYSGARQVVGMDVSPTALELTSRRLRLHRVDPERVRLMLLGDAEPVVPMDSGSVDHVNCGGVLHHTSNPELLLREFARVLPPGGTADVMVYQHDSVYVHLFVAYELMLLQGRYEGMTLDQAFEAYADGEGCPIARLTTPDAFLDVCRDCGLDGAYVGGYLSRGELSSLKLHLADALADRRLPARSREFLESLQSDRDGLPLHREVYAGLSGVFRLAVPKAGSEAREGTDAGETVRA